MSDSEYIANYKADRLYVNPSSQGAYASLASDGEETLGEIEVTSRFRIAVSAFFVSDQEDYRTYKITKLKYHNLRGWEDDGHIKINGFGLSKLLHLNEVIAALDLVGAERSRFDLGKVNFAALQNILSSDQASSLIDDLSKSPCLSRDIFAIRSKRDSLEQFESLIEAEATESTWQSFFENNPWIFGFGLKYVFLDKVSDKFETVTSGYEFDRLGKRVDGLTATKAAVSQYVLIEIKKSSTPLLRNSTYRSGCWSVSDEVSGAIAQIQKTSFEFSKSRFRTQPKNSAGFDDGDPIYSVAPRSVLVVGNLEQLSGHDDKVACFELFRSNVISPEIITFDELLHRSRQLVNNLQDIPAERVEPF